MVPQAKVQQDMSLPDVVLQQQPQELVVIDINYFPNYKGGSNTPALFRRALKQCWCRHQQQRQQQQQGRQEQ